MLFRSILVIFKGMKLIDEFYIDPYSESSALASVTLSNLCKYGIIVTLCANTVFNLLQLIFMKNLRHIDSLIQIPIVSVIFVLGVLILSRMVVENKYLKDDNDSII